MDKTDRMIDRMIDYALEKPDGTPNRVLIINFGSFSIDKVLTLARTELLRTILNEKPQTVGELTKMLKRPRESVSRDLKVLENYGLLSFKRSGRQKKPRVEKDIIAMQLTTK